MGKSLSMSQKETIVRLHEDMGWGKRKIARETRISRNTVKHWRFRFARERFAGLKTKPIPGRPRKARALKTLIVQRVVAKTLSSKT